MTREEAAGTLVLMMSLYSHIRQNDEEWEAVTMSIATLLQEPKQKKGYWEHMGGDEWLCTACGYIIHTEGSWETPEAKYCEECGADMREGE